MYIDWFWFWHGLSFIKLIGWKMAQLERSFIRPTDQKLTVLRQSSGGLTSWILTNPPRTPTISNSDWFLMFFWIIFRYTWFGSAWIVKFKGWTIIDFMVGTLIYCQGFSLFSAMHAFILVAHIALHRHAIKSFSDYHRCRSFISRCSLAH